MEFSKDRNFDFIDLVKSWFSSKNEPANVSRSFWMPDDSCVVCYDCDSQFTVINRRHHCRKCGRVFCAKCTLNSVPAESSDSSQFREDGERVRVCNFCFKQWQESLVVDDNKNNGSELPSPDGGSSVSVVGLSSPRVSSTPNKKDGSASFPCINGGGEHVLYGSAPSLRQYVQLEGLSERRCDAEVVTDLGRVTVDVQDGSLNQYSFCSNRSDDDCDEYEGLHSDFETQGFSGHGGCYSQNDFEVEQQGGLNDYHSTSNADHTVRESSMLDKAQQHTTLGVDKVEGLPVDNSDECNATSSIWGDASTHMEPFEFENSRELWHPPDPEDDEYDREFCYFDEDDEDDEGEDEDAVSEWRDASSSSSIMSSEYKLRDRLGELHKRAMKSIIGGHFRALVAQLLQVESISAGDGDENENWLDIVTYLSWEAASLLKPDTSSGGGMDPGLYVKVKCLACGRPSDSMLVKGVVCKKNVAHRRMTSKIEKPRVLVLGGSLEYQRVTNALSCFDTLLQQEMDHLKMAVAKIASHHPSVLLVEKSVSRFAQEYLLGKNISLVLNIKRPLLERIARCTGAEIVPSVDHLSSPKLGHCDLFHVEKFLEVCATAGQGGKKLLKTLMFFEGCPKPLGYTILLKGASAEVLKKIKHVVQYGVFAAYHLALETSFLADEGASLPELPLKSPITVALPDMPLGTNRSITTISDFGMSTGNYQSVCSLQRSNTSDPNLCFESFNKTQGSVLVLPENHNSQSTVAACIPDPLSDIKGVTIQNGVCAAPPISLSSTGELTNQPISSCCIGKVQNIILPEENHTIYEGCVCQSVPRDLSNFSNVDTLDRDGIMAHDKHIDSTDMIDRRQQYSSDSHFAHQANTQDDHEFSTSSSDHQSILVSQSSRCVWKGTVCERTRLLRIKYYGNFDRPLGRYLRDCLLNEDHRCQCCEMPYEAHVYCYTHRQGSLTISVRKLSDFNPHREHDGKIWMWHRCLRCPRINGFPPATRRVVMSDAAWGLSFGKFLELSFSNHAAASRVASCGHSLHRDCLRFYGCGKMVACFRYAPINVNSVYLPPPMLDFVYQSQKWVEEVNEVTDDAELLFTEVLNSLCQIAEERANAICADGNMKVELKKNISQLELILQKEKSEFEESLQNATVDGNHGKSIIDILEINKLQRKLLFLAYIWDRRLSFATHSCNNTQDMANSLMTKKNLAQSSAINNANLETCLLDSTNSEALNDDNQPSTEAQDGVRQSRQPNINKQNGLVEDGIRHKTQGKGHISTSKSVDNDTDALESGLAFRRVLSESQCRTPVDLSDTLDAKWTGEGGPAAPLDNKLKPLGVPEGASSLLASHVLEEHSGSETTKVTKLEQSAGAWVKLSFSDLYKSFNMNYRNVPRYDAWSEYVPKYIHSFKKLMDQGGRRLLLNLGVNETVIPVYDDEPTSIIAFALVSPSYHHQVFDELEKYTDCVESSFQLAKQDSRNNPQHHSVDNLTLESFKSFGSLDDSINKGSLVLDPPTSAKAMHVKVSFPDDVKVKYTVTCYFAKCFDALRRLCCPSELDFIQSISRCKKWGAQGGKSNVFFAKTLDDRFIIKQVTKTELESFIEFAPGYFKYLSESIVTGSPTCLAKILGIYQVTVKHLNSGKETRMDLLVMENLLFARKVTRLYDLKGSTRSRYNADKSGDNKVLLDQNLIEAMPTSPIFVGNKAKRLLERAVWNDTAFLASIDVMDYSLLVGVDEEKNELILGIIDFMRQYTWDKHLETWVKTTGILGGQRNVSPTVISPKQYKIRFRKAMSAYFLVVQDDWSQTLVTIDSQSEPS